MKKSTTMIGAGIIIIVILLVPTLSAKQALAKPVSHATADAVRAFWPEAQVQVGEFTLTNFDLRAGNIHDLQDEKGSKFTLVTLNYDILQGDTLLCFCGAELTTTDNVLKINGFKSATLSPVTLDVCVAFDINFNCTESIPVILQAEWKGFGSLDQDHFDFQSRTFNVVFHGTSRDATGTGSLNGQNLGEGIDAAIFRNTIFTNTHGP